MECKVDFAIILDTFFCEAESPHSMHKYYNFCAEKNKRWSEGSIVNINDTWLRIYIYCPMCGLGHLYNNFITFFYIIHIL